MLFFVYSIILIFIFRAYELFIKRLFFSTLFFEKILQIENRVKTLLFIHLVINLYFKKIEKSRANYVKIQKILQLIEKAFYNDNNFINNSLLKLNSLKQYFCRHISLLKLFWKFLLMIIKKQLFLTTKKINKKTNTQTFINVLI